MKFRWPSQSAGGACCIRIETFVTIASGGEYPGSYRPKGFPLLLSVIVTASSLSYGRRRGRSILASNGGATGGRPCTERRLTTPA